MSVDKTSQIQSLEIATTIINTIYRLFLVLSKVMTNLHNSPSVYTASIMKQRQYLSHYSK